MNLLDEQLYFSFSSIPPIQSIQFSVSGVDDKPLILLGKTFISIAIDNDAFVVQFITLEASFFLQYWASTFYRSKVVL